MLPVIIIHAQIYDDGASVGTRHMVSLVLEPVQEKHKTLGSQAQIPADLDSQAFNEDLAIDLQPELH